MLCVYIRGQPCAFTVCSAPSCQAGFFGQWSLVRHTAGMLKKRVEDLGPVSRGGA